MSQLLGADGKPIRPKPSEADRLLEEYVKLGPVRDRGSYVEIDKQALADLARQKARDFAVTSVPSTPRHMIRDMGGAAVGRGHGRWPHVTTTMLRDVRYRAPILEPIHQARQHQIKRMACKWDGKKGSVGIRVVHKDHIAHDAKPPEGFEKWVERFEEILWTPSPSYEAKTLADALAMLEEDLLTINRPTVEIIPSAVNPRRIVQWRPVDGGIIWPTLLWVEKWVADNPKWRNGFDSGSLADVDILDVVSGAIDHDLHGAEYVLVRDGLPEASYPHGRLIVAPIQNVTDIRFAGYPPSHVEKALALISAFITAFDYNASYFTKGMLAEFILGLPSDMHDDDVDAFLDMFRETTQGKPWQPPVIPLPAGGKDAIAKIDLKQSNREMMFEVWISLTMSLTASVYRADMSSINAKPWDGGSGPKLSEGSRMEEIALAREEGLHHDLGHIIDHILNPMAMRCHPHLRVIAEYGDYDPKKEADIYEIRGRVEMTRNEIRLEQGMRPMGFWMPPEKLEKASDEEKEKFDANPWNRPTDATFEQAVNNAAQLKQQKEMMAQQQQMPSPAGDDGQDDGFGGRDDGFGGSHPAGGPPNPYGTPQQPGQPPGPSPMAKGSRARHLHLHVHRDDGSYE